jgi:hypothetical protein
VFLEGFVGKNTRRANLNKITAEFVFKNSVVASTKIYPVMNPEDVKVSTSRIFPIESYASVALYAAVHLVIYKRAEILVPVSTFLKFIFTINVP